MASAELRKLLSCSICRNVCSDPVHLTCGHTFCRVCIDGALDAQEGAGGFSCPECRQQFQHRPALQRNIMQPKITEDFLPDKPDQEEDFGAVCRYCLHSPVPAAKYCLLCEASLCNNHLEVHIKSPEHVLVDPSTSPEDRKRSLHKKILEYNCSENSESIRVSCCLIGIHRGPQMESLDDITEKKKKKLTGTLQKLLAERREVEDRVRSLQESQRKVQEKADGETRRVIALFTDLRMQLEELEKKVLSEIARQVEQVHLPISRLIHQLEIKMDELSRKMRQTEELYNMTDPLTVLQDPDTGDLCDAKEGDNEDRQGRDEEDHDGADLDMVLISQTLRTGLSDILTGANGGIYVHEVIDIELDVNTATRTIQISGDLKTATMLGDQNRTETPESFQFYPQVISKRTFSFGRHFWEVDVRGCRLWKVGMCYPSIQRKGGERGEGGLSGLQEIGYNNKSWVMEKWDAEYFVIHDSSRSWLSNNITGDKIRVYLDYEAGQLSFYDLCEPMKHLHTFTATFTEPLHAALLIWDEYGHITVTGGTRQPNLGNPPRV